MASILFVIVPHTAEVERVFPVLGGFTLPAPTVVCGELGDYVGLLAEKGLAQDRRHHTHSRTPKEPGIDHTLVSSLIQKNLSDALEAARAAQELGEIAETRAAAAEGPTVADIDRAFAELELEVREDNANTMDRGGQGIFNEGFRNGR